MANKIQYICNNCNYQTLKWIGRCPECSEWDSFKEVQSHPLNTKKKVIKSLVPASDQPVVHIKRLISGIGEWDRVLGGGIMPGSLLVITGDPGIGKSTLLLQIAYALSKNNLIYYYSTEESIGQITHRAHRLACNDSNQLLFSEAAQLENIIAQIEQDTPGLAIIDSIQNCYTANKQHSPGSIGQLREATFELMRLAKEKGVSIIVSGHITKEGTIAGPKMLEHMVDAVFYLQGEDKWQTRILRSVKNRFGTINEVGFFKMENKGLKEIPNINEHLIHDTTESAGSALTAVMEGTRPLLLELQALTIASKHAMPQRVVTGIDYKQVVLIAAILEKYLQIKLSTHDIFFKISGVFKIKNQVSDVSIALALLSSYFQQPLPKKSISFGEISVTGHIKPINNSTLFIKEAQKFGIKTIFLSKQKNSDKDNPCIKRFATVYELLSLFS